MTTNIESTNSGKATIVVRDRLTPGGTRSINIDKVVYAELCSGGGMLIRSTDEKTVVYFDNLIEASVDGVELHDHRL